VNSNTAIGSLPRLQALAIVALFEKIPNVGPILTVVSNIGEYNTVVAIKCMM
jgi:hypothetical protein